jgi:hypothetical protein
MKTLRWILAFPLAALSWLYFPFLCSLIFPSINYYVGAYSWGWIDIPLCFFTPVVAFGIFTIVMPRGSRGALKSGILAFFIICLIGTGLVTFAVAIGGGTPNPLLILVCEPIGAIAGAGLAYGCLPLKVTDSN